MPRTMMVKKTDIEVCEMLGGGNFISKFVKSLGDVEFPRVTFVWKGTPKEIGGAFPVAYFIVWNYFPTYFVEIHGDFVDELVTIKISKNGQIVNTMKIRLADCVESIKGLENFRGMSGGICREAPSW